MRVWWTSKRHTVVLFASMHRGQTRSSGGPWKLFSLDWYAQCSVFLYIRSFEMGGFWCKLNSLHVGAWLDICEQQRSYKSNICCQYILPLNCQTCYGLGPHRVRGQSKGFGSKWSLRTVYWFFHLVKLSDQSFQKGGLTYQVVVWAGNMILGYDIFVVWITVEENDVLVAWLVCLYLLTNQFVCACPCDHTQKWSFSMICNTQCPITCTLTLSIHATSTPMTLIHIYSYTVTDVGTIIKIISYLKFN